MVIKIPNINHVVFTRTSKNATLPRRFTEGAAGYDLYGIDSVTLNPGEGVTLKTGLITILEPTVVGMIFSRSGLAARHGVCALTDCIKNNEEIKVTLKNHSNTPFTVEKGIRIAQLVFCRKDEKEFKVFKEPSKNEFVGCHYE